MVQISDLTKVYQVGETKVPALDGITLHIGKNEFVAIMGASGSGKSSLMNIIGCLDRPSSGTYRLDGREVGDLDDDELSRLRNQHLGFVFQNFNLLPRLTALQNTVLPIHYSPHWQTDHSDKAREVLSMVGLGERLDHRPMQLSGGECQRVAIARALINTPDLLLADEPTGNLDSSTAKEIMNIFQDLHRRNLTIIMITHEREIAAYAQRTIVLKDGRIIEDRTHG